MKKVFLFLALPVLAALLVKVMISSGVLEAMTTPARLLPIYYVDTPEKKLALSFDASWGTQHTTRLLEILEQNNIKTTFFLTGFWAEKYPELVKKIAAAGHELGNHTWTHPHLNTLDKRGIKIELERLHAALSGLTGVGPSLFRPPFGEYSNKVIEAANELGLLTIQWSIDSLDWKELSREAIVQRVTSRLHPGAIILFHNNGRYTADALPEIISFAKSQGYTIVPISELLHREDWYIDPADGAQRKRR
ncbi:MAG: Peptidoglycan-N-acetylglucosamine deacetylase [Syntrophomonadaceae bacterium]|nr:Peptidoglycan-N-acetylglucosamine deacetylase [Bacillota bacterium]